MSRWCTN